MADEQPLLEFAVPEELLREAIAQTRTEEAVADVALMPGVGEGAPPPLLPLLRKSGPGALAFLAAAAFLVQAVEAGVGVLAPDIQKTFDISDTALGLVAFASSAAYLGFGLPVALLGDRGRRVAVAAATIAIWGVVVPLMGWAPSVALFTVLFVVAGVGHAALNTVHISYLVDAYPIEARARVLAIHRGAEPLSRTIGAALMGGIAALAGGTAGWRWSFAIGVPGLALALAISRLREPKKGSHERLHILGTDAQPEGPGDEAPRLLFGSAVQRLMRIRSLYYQLVAMAVLGFALVGIPFFGSLYLERHWGLDAGERGLVFAVVAGAHFLSIPIAGLVGDRLYRRKPSLLLLLGGVSLAAFGVFFSMALYMPRLWMFVAGFFLAEASIAPLATAITQTVAATAPPAMRSLAFALFGIFSLVFGGFAGGVVLGAISDAHGPRVALTLMGPITIVGGILLALGSRYVARDITLMIEDVLEEHQEQRRRAAGGATNAVQVRNLDFSYGTQQVLFDVNLDVEEGEICALLGTNGAGKSTLLRAVAGLDHPTRGVIRLFGSNTTWLEAEQIVSMGVSMLPGGKVTFPSLTVEENLRAGSFAWRREPDLRGRIDRVYETFPVLASRRRQPAGTLSGGEQQMLGLGRALVHRPRLLLVDELTLGLAPKIVEELLAMVRAINAQGTTVVLVEQSVNLALTLADHSFFLERGQVRYDGPTAELLSRDDLLRPVFLGTGV